MNGFRAFLMPYSFLRRWSYDELIPALLYFDCVTFLMEDIGPVLLFTVSIENASSLDQQTISDDLRQAFLAHGVSLSQKANVTVVNPGSMWKIRDGNERFQVVKFLPDRLNVEASPEMGLVDPRELQGMDGNELAGGLLVNQHRYYWPMRDLIREEVILVTGMDMGGPLIPFQASSELVASLLKDKRTAPLMDKLFDKAKGLDNEVIFRPKTEIAEIEALRQFDHIAPLVNQYVESASRFYDSMTKDPDSLSPEQKANRVRCWIRDSLQMRRTGWAHVALDNNAFTALLTAETLFSDLRRIGQDDAATATKPWHQASLAPPTPASSYVAMRAVGSLLQKELHSFALKDHRDPEALSEILEVREKYRSELEAFRRGVLAASRSMQWNNPSELIAKADEYVREIEPAYEDVKRALSDPWRKPNLVLRAAGVLAATGIVAGLGTAVAGPIGAAVGGLVGGGLAEGVKALVNRLGADVTKSFETTSIPTEKAMAFLFHAQEAFR